MPRTRLEDGTVPLLDWLDSLPKKARAKCIARLQRVVPPREIEIAVARKKQFERAPEKHTFEQEYDNGKSQKES
jgi:hypothetical protein